MRKWRFSLRSALVSATFLAGIAALVSIACTDVGTTNYGDPTALRSQNLPGEGGVEAVVCGDGGVDGSGGKGGCSVSFSKDIYPSMTATGPWKCASTGKCHGAAQAPKIDGTSPATVIASLAGYIIKVNGKDTPYINQEGGTDPQGSSFECNMNGQCGQGMPISPGTPPNKDDICRIDAWLRCGAPAN